jgi:exodeoxyribonuclease VII large subunit
MGLQTTAEQPVPVRTVAHLIGQWISRLGKVWVEGQITQLVRRPGAGTVFVTLRDPIAEVSLQVTAPRGLLDSLEIAEGQRVVVFGKPQFYVPRGSVSLAAEQIRPVGLGELLARIEHVRRILAAEGLFATDRKQPLPFLPRTVGLVCGRASAAERDVYENARRRWPAVRFHVKEVAVQGPYAVTEVTDAIRALDRDPEVDVIIVARGGGSVEDLLPFSDESLVRAVAACRTPVVSAIGHEQDTPLLDLVADVRASTPTDAAKRVVPDVAEETTRVRQLRERARQVVQARLDAERAGLAALRSRPVLADPYSLVRMREELVAGLVQRARRCLTHALDRAEDDIRHSRARVHALSPAATLERGYAIVQRDDGHVVRAPDDVAPDDRLGIRLAKGRIAATVIDEDAAATGA